MTGSEETRKEEEVGVVRRDAEHSSTVTVEGDDDDDDDDDDDGHRIVATTDTDTDGNNNKGDDRTTTSYSKQQEEETSQQQQQQQQQSKGSLSYSSVPSSLWTFRRKKTAKERTDGGDDDDDDDDHTDEKESDKDEQRTAVATTPLMTEHKLKTTSSTTSTTAASSSSSAAASFWSNFVIHKAKTRDNNNTNESTTDTKGAESRTTTAAAITTTEPDDDHHHHDEKEDLSTPETNMSTDGSKVEDDTIDPKENCTIINNGVKIGGEASDSLKNDHTDNNNNNNNNNTESTTISDWIDAVRQRHEKLKAFERQRHGSFQSDYIALQAYTKVCGEIMEESSSEMQRLGGFVDGIWTAQQRFVEIMQERKRQVMLSKQQRNDVTAVTERNAATITAPPTFGPSDAIDRGHGEGSPERSTIQSTFDNADLDIGLAPPSTTTTVQTLTSTATAWDPILPPSSLKEERHIVAPLPSALSPLIEALEVSQNLWEAKFSTNNKQTASTGGILHSLVSTWLPLLQAQKEQLDQIRGKVFPTLTVKHESVQEAWDKYQETVQAVVQVATTHQKRQNRMRGVFSRYVVTPEEQQLALARDLADKADVWMAERVYQGAVQDLKDYWDESILGVLSNSEEIDVAKIDDEDNSDGDDEDVAVNNDSGIVRNTAIDECDKDGHDILPPACVLLRKILSTEAERRADLKVKLKFWIKGQENLLVGSEGATRFAWMGLNTEKSGPEESDTTSKGERSFDKEDGTKSIGGSVASDQEKSQKRTEADFTDDKRALDEGNASTEPLLPAIKPTTLKERRIQVLKQVEKILAEKYSKTVARDWLQSKRDASETLHTMEEIFGVESYLESPHVVSAAIGEWWEIKRPSTDEGSIDGRIEEPEYHLALVIVSSGPQMHLFDMDAKVDFVHLETPPQDALMELLSGKSFPDPVLSIHMSDAQVNMTDEVGTLEIFPNDPSVPCIRLVSPNLNNVS